MTTETPRHCATGISLLYMSAVTSDRQMSAHGMAAAIDSADVAGDASGPFKSDQMVVEPSLLENASARSVADSRAAVSPTAALALPHERVSMRSGSGHVPPRLAQISMTVGRSSAAANFAAPTAAEAHCSRISGPFARHEKSVDGDGAMRRRRFASSSSRAAATAAEISESAEFSADESWGGGRAGGGGEGGEGGRRRGDV
jgi:hypothetical protein